MDKDFIHKCVEEAAKLLGGIKANGEPWTDEDTNCIVNRIIDKLDKDARLEQIRKERLKNYERGRAEYRSSL